jgi:hypothetical protein
MKKLLILILVLSGTFTMVSAEIGVKVGLSAQIGSLETSGKETSTDGTTEHSGNEEALFATAGYFIEKDFKFLPVPILNRLSIGYDNIVHDLDLGTQSNERANSLGAADGTGTIGGYTNTVNAKVDGFETLYATLTITDWLYVKAGQVEVDVKTKYSTHNSQTGKYATNHTLDGSVFGVGLHHKSDNGLFFRLEWNDYDIDGKTVANTGTDSKFSATLNDVSGSTGRISIGKAF